MANDSLIAGALGPADLAWRCSLACKPAREVHGQNGVPFCGPRPDASRNASARRGIGAREQLPQNQNQVRKRGRMGSHFISKYLAWCCC